MFNRPFLPFRVRPVPVTDLRRGPFGAEWLAILETVRPLSIKAERKPVKGSRIPAAARQRVAIRREPRLARITPDPTVNRR